jgi:hypothetical protein
MIVGFLEFGPECDIAVAYDTKHCSDHYRWMYVDCTTMTVGYIFTTDGTRRIVHQPWVNTYTME